MQPDTPLEKMLEEFQRDFFPMKDKTMLRYVIVKVWQASREEGYKECAKAIGCIGPVDEPHRCNFAHCGNCGYCEEIVDNFLSLRSNPVIKD